MEPDLFWEYYRCTKRKEAAALARRTESNQGGYNGNSVSVEMRDKWLVDTGGKDVETEVKGFVVTRGRSKNKIFSQ